MIDLPPPDAIVIAQYAAPAATERRKSRRRRDLRGAAIAIGTILVLSNGTRCLVVAHDAEGEPVCEPLPDDQ